MKDNEIIVSIYRPAVEPRESQAWEENGFLFSFHAENRSRL